MKKANEKPQLNDLELCFAYCFFVLGQESYGGEIADFPVMDNTRIWLHDKICETMGLSKDATRSVTDHLNRYQYNPHRVYEALWHIKEGGKS